MGCRNGSVGSGGGPVGGVGTGYLINGRPCSSVKRQPVGLVGVAGDVDLAAVDQVVAVVAAADQVGGFGQSMVAAEPLDVVDFETECGVAAGDAAAVPITMQHHSPQGG